MPRPTLHNPVLTSLGCRIFENSICDEMDKEFRELAAGFSIMPLIRNRIPITKRSRE
jgi:hypothetical protein